MRMYIIGTKKPVDRTGFLYSRVRCYDVVECFVMARVASKIRSSRASCASIASTTSSELCVSGFFGINIVQQSSCGRMEVSNVPISFAFAIISFLSNPTSGRMMGSDVAAPIERMLSIV